MTTVGTGTATITVTSAATTNYKSQTATYSITVSPGTINYSASNYSRTYDGSYHGISVSVTSPGGTTIEYSDNNSTWYSSNRTKRDPGTYTVYYRISKTGYTTVTGSKTVTIGKANGSVTLSTRSVGISIPNSSDDRITGNTSGGTLSVSSSNTNVATASVEYYSSTAGSYYYVHIVSGTTTGSATITVTSAETTYYNSASTTISVNIYAGTISYNAYGWTGTYDGSYHGITVSSNTSGATIKYGTTSGTYNLTSSPTYRTAGTYTVYYQITKSGYNTVTGSATVTIRSGTTYYVRNGTVERTLGFQFLQDENGWCQSSCDEQINDFYNNGFSSRAYGGGYSSTVATTVTIVGKGQTIHIDGTYNVSASTDYTTIRTYAGGQEFFSESFDRAGSYSKNVTVPNDNQTHYLIEIFTSVGYEDEIEFNITNLYVEE